MSNLGINKYVGDLSYAEKRLLIVISLTQQLSEATNDFGRTIESPANQMRILSEQWERLSRSVGNVFMPILAKVLPYLNAIMMVLTEIVSVIATLVGYNAEDFDYFGGTADSVIDLEESLDGASESAKKLKQGLRGFDKLNVITTPTNNSAGSGTNVDPAIMDAFNKAFDDYNSKLTDVKMKATEIRDAIMKWLGFTKLVNKETDETIFKFERITSGTVLGGLAVGGSIFLGVSKIVGLLGKLGSSSGGLSILGGLSGSSIAVVGGIAGGVGLLAYSIYDLYQTNEEFAQSFDEKWAGLQATVSPIVESLKELFGILVQTYEETLKPMIEESYEVIQTLATTILEILYPVFSEFILPILDQLIQIITDIFTIINDLWTEYGEPISNAIKEAIQGIADIFLKLWKQFLSPIIEKIKKIIKDLWDNTLKPMVEKVGKAIGGIIELILALWNNVLEPIVKWVIDVFAPLFETAFSFIGDAIHTVVKFIGGVINGLLDIFNGVIDFLVGIFTLDFKRALDGLVGILKGIANIMISIVEGIINGVIDLVNLGIKFIYNAIKSFINVILGTVEGIADFLGFDIDITLKGEAPQIPKVSIPRLKTGMDFVPNDYYPAYLDYGERVLTKEENREYMANQNMNNTGEANMTQTFNIYVGDEEVASVVLDKLDNIAKTNGKPITIGG